MSAKPILSTGARLLVGALADAGVARVYGMPQALDLPLWDCLKGGTRGEPPLKPCVPVSDLGGAFMALGDGRLERAPAALLLTPSPGLDQSLSAIGEARLLGVPMLVVVTLPGEAGSDAFERLPLRPFKNVLIVESAPRIAEVVAAAWSATREGRGGPVALLLPERLLGESAPRTLAPVPDPGALLRDPEEPAKIERAIGMLHGAHRPGIMVGPGALPAATELAQLAQNLGAPSMGTALGRGALGDDHPLAIGHGDFDAGPRHARRIVETRDVILAVGIGRVPPPTRKGVTVIQIDSSPDPASAADLVIASDPRSALPLLSAAGRRAPERKLRERIQKGKRDHAASLTLAPREDGVQPELFYSRLRSRMARDGVLVVDAGRHALWALHAFSVYQPNTFHVPASDQALGLALPAAIGAKLAQPDRPVVTVTGHASFLVTAIELRTAVDLRVPLPVFVLEEKEDEPGAMPPARGRKGPGVDFRALAQALGARNVRIENDLALDAGLDAALASADRPTLCHVRILYDRPAPSTSQDHGRAGRISGVRSLARALTRRLWRRS
ncbi:MAG: thiamine pyrophosphate-dependent enzyme [Acidobacteriota bacterium]